MVLIKFISKELFQDLSQMQEQWMNEGILYILRNTILTDYSVCISHVFSNTFCQVPYRLRNIR
jgi:hypothetical protein